MLVKSIESSAFSSSVPRLIFDQSHLVLIGFIRSEMTDAPIIKFLGLFDTVQMSWDAGDLDVSQTQSVKAIRHALALNEERLFFPPSVYEYKDTKDNETSIVQAWFVGTHMDIGGGAEYDGLSLYPLQWMLLESKLHGLVLEHNSNGKLKGLIEDPLHLVFPPPPTSCVDPDTQSASDSDQSVPWVFEYSNGLKISMHDMRTSHNHGNLQKVIRHKLHKRSKRHKDEVAAKEPLHRSCHFVRLNIDLWGQFASYVQSGSRDVFQSCLGELKGYSESGKSDDQSFVKMSWCQPSNLTASFYSTELHGHLPVDLLLARDLLFPGNWTSLSPS